MSSVSTVDFSIGQNDLLEPIEATLSDVDGPVNLTNATGVRFHMRNKSTGVVKVAAAAEFVSKAAGTVKYQWTGTDTDTAGDYDAEWQVIFPTDKPLTFPNNRKLLVRVFKEVA